MWGSCQLWRVSWPTGSFCLPSLHRLPGSQPFASAPLAPVVSQPAVLQPYGPPPTSAQVTAQLAGMQISGAVAPAPPPSGLGYGEYLWPQEYCLRFRGICLWGIPGSLLFLLFIPLSPSRWDKSFLTLGWKGKWFSEQGGRMTGVLTLLLLLLRPTNITGLSLRKFP